MFKILIIFLFFSGFAGYCEIVKIYHTVKKGETLIAIAKEYGTTVEKIKELNGMKSSLIRAGERIIVKKIEKNRGKTGTENYNPSHPVFGYDTVYYKVRKGDSLWKISKKYGVSVSSIKRENRLKSNFIKPGMILRVKVPRKAPKIDQIKPIIGTGGKIFYQVKKGDTLESVAKKFGLTPEEIKNYNLLGEEDFKEGQIVIIPQKEKLSDKENTETQIEKEQFSRADIVSIAFKYLNMPYKLGGDGKKYIDCSTLTRRVYEEIGIQLPETSYFQYKEGKKVSLDEALPGDLIFFRRGNRVGHVGIYIGDGLFIHASNKQGKVTISSLQNRYFRRQFVCVKRYIPDVDKTFAKRLEDVIKE